MRKLLLILGLLVSGSLLASNPASAAVGCACVKIGTAPVCVASIDACVSGMGGLCLAPCDYTPPKAMKKVKHQTKKAMKKTTM